MAHHSSSGCWTLCHVLDAHFQFGVHSIVDDIVEVHGDGGHCAQGGRTTIAREEDDTWDAGVETVLSWPLAVVATVHGVSSAAEYNAYIKVAGLIVQLLGGAYQVGFVGMLMDVNIKSEDRACSYAPQTNEYGLAVGNQWAVLNSVPPRSQARWPC